jgi:Mg2+/Co2+ transporter CorB
MDMNNDILGLVSIVVLLGISALFSIAETALTAASRAKMHHAEKQGSKRAAVVNHLRQDSESLIGSLLVGNNLVNILATVLTTTVLTSIFGEAGVIYATAAMTIAIIIFAEVLPKTYAFNHADKVAMVLAYFVRGWLWFSWPLTWTIQKIARLLLRMFGVKTSAELGRYLGDEELLGAIDLHGNTPDRDDVQQERAMLRSILDLDAVTVEKIMTHRRKAVMLDVEMPKEELIEAVLSSPYTRIPLWKDDPSNVVGVLHAKPLLRALRQTPDVEKLDILDLANEPWFIPETVNLLDQLQEFRERREHFALVVDEYGALMGIVTLEDILEEIVGEISDELDSPVTGVRRHPDGSYLVQGSVTIRDLNRQFDWGLPENPAATLAGLIMHEARQLPDIGQVYSFFDFRFEIVRRQRHQVTLIKVKSQL